MSDPCDFAPLVGELMPYIQGKASRACLPLNVTFELTLGCNIRCQHCYNFDRDGAFPVEAKHNSLSAQEILRVMREVREAGCLFVQFTGGEPLLHPHLFDFVALAAELNMAVQILTNGTLLDEAMLARFARYPNINGFSISFYGATAATHDAITQSPGSFERTVRGAQLAHAAGYRTLLKYIIMQRNVGEVEAALQLAERIGVKCLVDATVTPRHDGNGNSLATRIDNAQIEKLYRGPLRHLIPDGAIKRDEHNFMCNCAQGNCAVSATGEVQPCISVPLSGGNVRTQSFKDIWQHSELFNRLRGYSLKDFLVCRDCGVRDYCERNPGGALLAGGGYTAVDPWTCKNAEITKEIIAR